MTETIEFEYRISTALDRIGRGLEVLARPAPSVADAVGDAAETMALREALAAERAANAQLSERVRAIRDKQDTTLGALERKFAVATRELEQMAHDMAQFKRANADLAEANRALLEAAPDAALADAALRAELDSLRAERAADRAELDAILAGLDALLAAEPEQTAEGQDA